MTLAATPAINEAMIHALVHDFYARVRVDPVLVPVFAAAIGSDWDAHLDKMCAFWSSVMLTTGRYQGSPMQAHRRLPDMEPAYFERWLALFKTATDAVCPPPAAELFCQRAANIARSLQLGLFYRPAAQGT